MTAIVNATDASFEQDVEQQAGITIVDFWTTWCAPCRAIAPMLELIAAEYAGEVRVVKFNMDDHTRTAVRFSVRSVPTLLFFKDGKVVTHVVGAVPRARVEAALAQCLTVPALQR